MFDTTCQEVSTQNLILCILNQQNSIEIDQLLTGIQEKISHITGSGLLDLVHSKYRIAL